MKFLWLCLVCSYLVLAVSGRSQQRKVGILLDSVKNALEDVTITGTTLTTNLSFSSLRLTVPRLTTVVTVSLDSVITPTTSILPMTRTTTVLTCPPPTLTPKTLEVIVPVIVKGANPWAATSTATVNGGTTTKTLFESLTASATFIRTTNALSSTSFPGQLYDCNKNDATSAMSSLPIVLLVLLLSLT